MSKRIARAAALLTMAVWGWIAPHGALAQLPLPTGSLIVTVTSPVSGATVSGAVTVSASVSIVGALTVAGVQFKRDGVNIGAEDTGSPYSVSWNTTTTTNGSHTLTAVARDVLGVLWTSDPVTVTVANDTTPPSVSITSPASAATVSGTTTVTASASDNVGVVGVRFFLDGVFGGDDTGAPYSVPWNTTGAANGSHTLTAVARDAAGNTRTSAPVTVTVANDTTRPTVTINQAVTQADPTSASPINFTAVFSEAVSGFTGADVTITGTAGGTKTVTVSGGPSTYNMAVGGMTTGGTVIATIAAGGATDAAGNTNTASTSTNNTVTLDTTPPTASVTSPASGATVSGTIAVAASASDAGGVTLVQFLVDGVELSRDTTIPYEAVFDTSQVTDGTHTLQARALDTAGNIGESAVVTVTVANGGAPDTTPPVVTVTSLNNGDTVSGVITLTANATDAGGVTVVQFLLDGAQLGALDSAAPYEAAWDTRTVADGSHTLQARAQDAAGNIGESAVVTVTVSNAGATVPSRFEEDNPAISASPADAWVRRGAEVAAFSGGTAGSSDVVEATMTFTFTGTAVSWIGLKCSICGIATVSIDGGAQTSVDTAGPAAPGSAGLTSEAVFAASGLTAGSHTMVITVTGTSTSGGAHIVVDAFDVTGGSGSAATRIEESNPAVSFAGAWVPRGAEVATFSGASAGSSDVSGATATFTFTGTAVSWIGLRCSACGIANVSIDGGAASSVDTVGAAAPGSPGLASQAVFTASGLAAGSHNLVITVTGTTTSGGAHVIVDAFDVTP